MPQIHLPYSSQLDLTVAALPTINIAEGSAGGQEGPPTTTLIFNDENKQENTLPHSNAGVCMCTCTCVYTFCFVAARYTSTLGPCKKQKDLSCPRFPRRGGKHHFILFILSSESTFPSKRLHFERTHLLFIHL